MSVSRMINSKFWSDSFVVDKLNPLDRYLFLYFLTNEKTNISGVYEIPLRTIANETGLDKDEIVRMLERLQGKVEYKDGWVCLVNFLKHQSTKSQDVQTGINKQMALLPTDIQNWVRVCREGLGTVYRQPEVFNLTKPNLTYISATPTEVAKDVSKKKKIPEILTWEKKDKEEWKDKLLSQGLRGEVLLEYIILKEMKFPTRESANEELKRSIKVATTISKSYPDLSLVKKTMDTLKSKYEPDMWTLETVLKKLPLTK